MAFIAERREASQMRLNGAKKRMLSAGRAIFRRALPIAAAIMISCTPRMEAETEVECDMHNESTVTINESGSGDGRVAGIDELRVPEGLISSELAFAVRACHGLASAGLPDDIPATVTNLPEECLINPDTGYVATAYAITPHTRDSRDGDYGIYTHLYGLTLDDFSMIAHEIGHLQADCGEFGAEANSAEQMLMLFVAYSRQENSIKDGNRWAAQATNQLYGLEALYDALRHIYQDNFRLDPDPITSMHMHPKWKYIKADIYIYESLIRHDGDFLAVRQEMESLGRRDLQLDAQSSMESFVGRYSGSGMYEALGEIVANLRMAHYRELSRRFGTETARRYFDSNSHSAYWLSEPRSAVRAVGLEGMNCLVTHIAEEGERADCDSGCEAFGADAMINIEGTRLNCFTVEYTEPPGFQNWEVRADGRRYIASDGGQIFIGSAGFRAVVVFDSIVMDPVE